MKLELQERTDHKGEPTYWIIANGSAEIPIYRDRDEAIEAYESYVHFYKNPPAPTVLLSDVI